MSASTSNDGVFTRCPTCGFLGCQGCQGEHNDHGERLCNGEVEWGDIAASGLTQDEYDACMHIFGHKSPEEQERLIKFMPKCPTRNMPTMPGASHVPGGPNVEPADIQSM